ncbi:DUF4123 domain-containing protein [uncultured Pseudacidovorax sp.]|uniref:DUF4123 domain-containing protein n=1 Tax=uncultured Pseudacidovorax sp. TaxID=679313 RepID=UPI0025FC8407|nr:DUF4123 domain-containing protein [uncultured Pseudacidovorax sp.]
MSEYYGVDPISPATVAACQAAWAQALNVHPSLQFYALVDAAFDEAGFAAFLQSFEGRAASLYAGTELSELDSVAPWLLELNTNDPAVLSAQLQQLAQLRRGRPMCSFLGSSRGMDALRLQFRPRIHAQADDLRLILRFADTRVLETLAHVLRPAQMDVLFPPDTYVWFPCRREGQAATRQVADDRPLPPDDAVLHIDPGQFAALIDAGEADLVIHALAQQDPGCFGNGRPSDVHAFVVEQLIRARQHGLTHFQDLEAYCMAALAGGAAFDEQPSVAFAIVEAGRAPGSLAASLAALPWLAWKQAREHSIDGLRA